MAGRGPAPKAPDQRRTRARPIRGDWKATPGIGWQQGAIPEPPSGLCATACAAWQAWMQSWIAAHWSIEDLPALRITIELYDQCERAFEDPYIEKTLRNGKDTVFVPRPNPTTELRQYLDNYGISKKGQQDRRWAPPKAEAAPDRAPQPAIPDRYAHLKLLEAAS